MATTGHENESINVSGLKASLQSLKSTYIDNTVWTNAQTLSVVQKDQAVSNILDKTDTSGMKRVVLKKSDNFKTKVEAQTGGNTIFVIQYDYTLSGNVTIPSNCILDFEGGKLISGGTNKNTITSQNTEAINLNVSCLNNILIIGGLHKTNHPQKVFDLECYGDYINRPIDVFGEAVKSHTTLNLPPGTLNLTNSTYNFNIIQGFVLEGGNNSEILLKHDFRFSGGNGNTIKNCTFTYVEGSDRGAQLLFFDMSALVFENNIINGYVSSNSGIYGGGIHVFGENTNIFSITIRNNKIYSAYLDGILVHSGVNQIQILNNQVENVTAIGIEVEGRKGSNSNTVESRCNFAEIKDNYIRSDYGDKSILVMFSNIVSINGNTASGGQGIGIIGCTYADISSNFVDTGCINVANEVYDELTLNSYINVVGNVLRGRPKYNLQNSVLCGMIYFDKVTNGSIIGNKIEYIKDTSYDSWDAGITLASCQNIQVLSNSYCYSEDTNVLNHAILIYKSTNHSVQDSSLNGTISNKRIKNIIIKDNYAQQCNVGITGLVDYISARGMSAGNNLGNDYDTLYIGGNVFNRFDAIGIADTSTNTILNEY